LFGGGQAWQAFKKSICFCLSLPGLPPEKFDDNFKKLKPLKNKLIVFVFKLFKLFKLFATPRQVLKV
jgi:hypothetical protein